MAIVAKTAPNKADTDGDGFDDRDEFNPGGTPVSDPLDAQSTPIRSVVIGVGVRQAVNPAAHLKTLLISTSVRNTAAPESVSRTASTKVVGVQNGGTN